MRMLAGTPAAVLGELPTFAEFTDFIGLPEVREIEQHYIANEPATGPEAEG